ncbi:MAG: hypothetical protein ABIS14_10330 [Sphingomonas sp.]
MSSTKYLSPIAMSAFAGIVLVCAIYLMLRSIPNDVWPIFVDAMQPRP